MNYHHRALITFTDFSISEYNSFSSSHYDSKEHPHIFKIVGNLILEKDSYKHYEKLWKRIHGNL